MPSNYTPEIVPSDLNDPVKLQAFLDREHRNISKALDFSNEIRLDPLYVTVPKPEEGIIVYADGTSFNPTGEGEGYYGYKNGAYTKLDNVAYIEPNGSIIDTSVTNYTANTTITGAAAIIPIDNTVPLITEGVEILSLSHTPKSTTNKLLAIFQGQVASNGAANQMGAMFVGSTNIDSTYTSTGAAGSAANMIMMALFSPGSVAAQTVSVRIGVQVAGNQIALNGFPANPLFGGASNATLTVFEVKA